jgi:hypothetical protein
MKADLLKCCQSSGTLYDEPRVTVGHSEPSRFARVTSLKNRVSGKVWEKVGHGNHNPDT